MGKCIAALFTSIVCVHAFSNQAFGQDAQMGNWQIKNEPLRLETLNERSAERAAQVAVPVQSKLKIIAERPSPIFPNAPYAAQATSTSVKGDDIVVSFATMGEPTGGGIEWIKWTNGAPVVVGQFFLPEVDVFSVTQVSDAIVGVGQVKGKGAAIFTIRKLTGDSMGRVVAVDHLEDFSGVEVRTESEGPQGGIIRVLTGSNGAVHWFSIAPQSALVKLGSNLEVVNPMGSVNSRPKQISYLLEGNGPQQLSMLDRAGYSRHLIGNLNLGEVGAPASLFVEGNKVITNAGVDQIRTYRMNSRASGGGLTLRHFQQLPGLGNDLDIQGPFVALSQGNAGLLIGFMSQILEPITIQQVFADSPMSANKGTMVRVGQQNLVFLSGGRNGMKVLEQQTNIKSKDEQRHTFHGPARFWMNQEIPEFKNAKSLELYFDKQDGTNLRCRYLAGKFCVCNRPVPAFVDFKSVYVDWVRTKNAPTTVEVPIGYAIH